MRPGQNRLLEPSRGTDLDGGAALNDSPESGEGELRAELARLRVRLAAVEAERDELARRNSELFIFQQVLSAINSALDLDDVLSLVLRGVREALGCSRLVLFDVHEGGVSTRMATQPDGSTARAGGSAPLALAADCALLAVATGRLEYYADRLAPQAPLEGLGPYLLTPLVARGRTLGVLYVDCSGHEPLDDDSIRMVLDFASQAAMAMETTQLLEETKRLALVDHLTGLANARRLNDQIEHELALAERHEQPLAFVIMDLDDLKQINDRSGHAAGDEALRRFAQTLRACARASDIVARYGGDEFVVAMPQTDEVAARIAVSRILPRLDAAGVRASVGIAVYPSHARDARALFDAADRALYQAKHAGKNRFAVAAPPPENGGVREHSEEGTPRPAARSDSP